MDPFGTELEHRLNEIDAKLVAIGEHIFAMRVVSESSKEVEEPEKKYYVGTKYGPMGGYLSLIENRRSKQLGRRDVDSYSPSTLESIHGDRRKQYDRRSP